MTTITRTMTSNYEETPTNDNKTRTKGMTVRGAAASNDYVQSEGITYSSDSCFWHLSCRTVGRCLRDVLYISDALLHLDRKARVSTDTVICMNRVYRDSSCICLTIENAFPASELEGHHRGTRNDRRVLGARPWRGGEDIFRIGRPLPEAGFRAANCPSYTD